MRRINYLVDKYPDLFKFLPGAEVHIHDHFINRILLKFLPEYVTPNRVTTLRIILTPIVFLLILFNCYRLGISLFLFAAFTDVVDGTLARTRKQVTKFGIMFDPLADKLLIGSLVLLLVFQNFNFWLGFVLLGIEIAFIASALVAKYKFKTIRMANLWGKIKMILQVMAVFCTLLWLGWGDPFLFMAAYWLFGLAIGFAVISLFTYGI